MDTLYGTFCHECGDISVMPAEKEVHIGIARKHNESIGHTCEVYKETKSVVFNGRTPEIVSHSDREVVETFD